MDASRGEPREDLLGGLVSNVAISMADSTNQSSAAGLWNLKEGEWERMVGEGDREGGEEPGVERDVQNEPALGHRILGKVASPLSCQSALPDGHVGTVFTGHTDVAREVLGGEDREVHAVVLQVSLLELIMALAAKVDDDSVKQDEASFDNMPN